MTVEINSLEVQVLEEFRRRSEHTINIYKPTTQDGHNQLSYHQATSRYRLLFGGNQSGKSRAAAHDCVCNARGRNEFTNKNIKGRDIEIWVISAEYATIKNGIYRHIRMTVPDWELIQEGARIPGTDLPTFIKIKRPDGYKTTVTFMSAKGENREKFQAAAVDYFYIDEEIQADIWEELEARTLATGGQFSISATLVESYEWILELERRGDSGDPHVFVTRLNTELNRYLDQETVAYLKNKWSKDTLEYRFYGRSRKIQGLIYNNWDDRKHVVPPFKVPKEWPRFCAIDPGIRTTAVLWLTVSPAEKAYAYREMYAHNEPLWQVALEIKKCEGWKYNTELAKKFQHYVFEESDDSEHMVLRIIDPKSRARSEAGEMSILDQLMTRYGLLCSIADNSIRPGIEDCRYWLENGFHIFNTLVNFQDERRTYRFRPKNRKLNQSDPIEDPIKKNNHLMDCWRYIAREKPKYVDRTRAANYPEDQREYESPHDVLARKAAEVEDYELMGVMYED